MKLPTVAVLFARADSIYKSRPDCDVWDAERDALKWEGGSPIVAHPPCRAWGQLAHFAKPRPDEKQLAIWAVEQIRKWGGVLEHPAKSKLWPTVGLPEPGERDEWGGFTLPILQWWWGHKAEKATRLYICGCDTKDLPPIPLRIGEAEYAMQSGSLARGRAVSQGAKPGVTKPEREHTPPALAEWLIQVARLCERKTAVNP
jgi:hypothetical protein